MSALRRWLCARALERWDPSLHPRAPKGTSAGGQFISAIRGILGADEPSEFGERMRGTAMVRFTGGIPGGGSISVRMPRRSPRLDDRVRDRSTGRLGTIAAVIPDADRSRTVARVRWDDGQVETRPLSSLDVEEGPRPIPDRRTFDVDRGQPPRRMDDAVERGQVGRPRSAAERMRDAIAAGAVVGRDRERALAVARGSQPAPPKVTAMSDLEAIRAVVSSREEVDRITAGMKVSELREVQDRLGLRRSGRTKAEIRQRIAQAIVPDEADRPAKKAAPKKATPRPMVPSGPRTDLSSEDQKRARRLIRRDPQIVATIQDRFGRISSSGNLSQEDEAWLQGIYERDRAFVEREAQAAQIDRRIRDEAKKAGQSPAEYRASVGKRLKELFEGKPIAVRVRDEGALRDILSGGRFKTQHEGAKRAPGLGSDVDRRRLGEEVLGVPADTPPEQRPVYGYVAIRGIEPALSAGRQTPGIRERQGQEDVLSSYGQVQVVLKPEVRDRTTATVGDSLDEIGFVRPTPVNEPTVESLGVRGLDSLERPDFTRTGYVEAQIHGGVRTEDIAEVVFSGQPAASTVAALDRAGVPWRILRPGDKPDSVQSARAGIDITQTGGTGVSIAEPGFESVDSATTTKDYSYGAGSGLGRGTVQLSGNTYAHREWLKSIGARWDKQARQWKLRARPTNNRELSALAYELRRRGIEF